MISYFQIEQILILQRINPISMSESPQFPTRKRFPIPCAQGTRLDRSDKSPDISSFTPVFQFPIRRRYRIVSRLRSISARRCCSSSFHRRSRSSASRIRLSRITSNKPAISATTLLSFSSSGASAVSRHSLFEPYRSGSLIFRISSPVGTFSCVHFWLALRFSGGSTAAWQAAWAKSPAANQAAGLLTISVGLSRMYRDDLEQLIRL